MGNPGSDRAPRSVNPGDSATRQEVCHEGPPTRTQWGGYHLARAGGPPGWKGVQYPQNQTSNLKPVKEVAHDQLSEIASTIPPVDPSCVELKQSAFLAELLLEEVDLESTSGPTSPVGKPVLHMNYMHSGEPMAESPYALPRPASNNMPMSEHDTQEL